MKRQPYTKEFKIKAVKQITARGHQVADVYTLLNSTQKCPPVGHGCMEINKRMAPKSLPKGN